MAGVAMDLVHGEAYEHQIKGAGGGVIRITHDKSKGLSFQLWPSALALTGYLEGRHAKEPGLWQGKRILELGAGCGLVGLCAASLGAHATLTDLACVLPVLEHHLRLNRSVISDAGGQVDCHTLHWGRDEDLNGLPKFDLIVAADVVYHRELMDPLLHCLTTLTTQGDRVVLAHVRRWKTDAYFFKRARKLFDLTVLSCVPPLVKQGEGGQVGDAAIRTEVHEAVGAQELGRGMGGKGAQVLLELIRK